jgi:hypothetical protein
MVEHPQQENEIPVGPIQRFTPRDIECSIVKNAKLIAMVINDQRQVTLSC